MKFIEFFLFHLVLTLVVVEVVIRSETVAAELTTTAHAVVSVLYLVFLAFYVGLKLFWTRKIGVTGIATLPRRFRDRRLDRQVNGGNRT